MIRTFVDWACEEKERDGRRKHVNVDIGGRSPAIILSEVNWKKRMFFKLAGNTQITQDRQQNSEATVNQI